MPFGPYILCADMERRSMFIASTSTGSLPTPWVASLWKRTPFSRATLPISAMGLMVPISLLANMIETSTVLSVIARLLGVPAVAVAPAGRVTEGLGEIGHHRLEHPRIERGRGVVVHVDSLAVHDRDSSERADNPDSMSPLYGGLPPCQPSGPSGR